VIGSSPAADRLQAESAHFRELTFLGPAFDDIIGESPALRSVLFQAEQVASTDTTVLLLGETGTGKELIAKAIHARSHRHHRALVKVNCAALPSTLIESELFYSRMKKLGIQRPMSSVRHLDFQPG
jgi:formate hydrogenlyase transcriptional activator